jgi:hypothetical protein
MIVVAFVAMAFATIKVPSSAPPLVERDAGERAKDGE